MIERFPKESKLVPFHDVDFTFRIPPEKIESPYGFDRTKLLDSELSIDSYLVRLTNGGYTFALTFKGFPGVKEQDRFFFRDIALKIDQERYDKAWALYYFSSFARMIHDGRYSIDLHDDGRIQLSSRVSMTWFDDIKIND